MVKGRPAAPSPEILGGQVLVFSSSSSGDLNVRVYNSCDDVF